MAAHRSAANSQHGLKISTQKECRPLKRRFQSKVSNRKMLHFLCFSFWPLAFSIIFHYSITSSDSGPPAGCASAISSNSWASLYSLTSPFTLNRESIIHLHALKVMQRESNSRRGVLSIVAHLIDSFFFFSKNILFAPPHSISAI